MSKWSYYVFVPGYLDKNHVYPNKDLNFDNMLVLQMFMLHTSVGEAYPANCTVGYGPEDY